MKRMLIVITLPLLLGGCVLPLQAKLAMWALDGISYLATKKTVTDHGISAITGKDCAMLRILGDDPICTDQSDKSVLVADRSGADVRAELVASMPLEHQAGMLAPYEMPIRTVNAATYFSSQLSLPEVAEPSSVRDPQVASVGVVDVYESRDPAAMGAFPEN